MKLLRLAVVTAMALTLGAGTIQVADAATPKSSGTYSGTSTESDQITLKVSKTGSKVSGVLKDSCGDSTKFSARRITGSGKFELVKKHPDFDIVIFTVTGKFVSKKKAKGTIHSISCEGSTRGYVAKLR